MGCCDGKIQERFSQKSDVFKTSQDIRARVRRMFALESFHNTHTLVLFNRAIKLIAHAQDGVKEGREDPERGVPLEVMGNLLGYIDPEDGQCLVITDSFITPCKGGAHSSDPDSRTGGYRAEYEEIYGLTNPRVKQVGWYHSHPFEPLNDFKSCTTHHCWFSAIDVGTQTQAQGIADKYGMPYVGLVIDPQTTLERRQIHFGVFRLYNRQTCIRIPKDRTPDGKSLRSFGDSANNSRWGDQWDKYYALDVSFFTNEENKKTLSILNASYGWINDLVLMKTSQSTYKQQMNRQAISFEKACTKACGQMQSGVKVFDGGKAESQKDFVKNRTGAIESGTDVAVDEIRRIAQSLVL